MGYWENVLIGKLLIIEKGMVVGGVVSNLSCEEWCVVMTRMLIFKFFRLMGRLELFVKNIILGEF